MSEAFDVIPYDDIKGDWKKLGSGSFGNVYKGTYLGIDVAIKEVLPSTEYDVAKYFEREWRLMKEARHPNVVLYLGLSRAPAPDSRIFIISEYIENGNLRQYIHSKSSTHPFPWRMRISFATDIARALAYLHARSCLHRDLKGENLLLTSNGRLKITDFGFARITPRSVEEQKRLTFCGTDSYMSPEILMGEEFSLPTDIYSLGIIFCEISARKLADDHIFKRAAPTFAIDPDEIRMLASPGCPPGFLELCIDCLESDPAKRPNTRVILERLRLIEADVLSRPTENDDAHVGSVKFMTGVGGKRPAAGPRIPSFGMGIGKDIRTNSTVALAPEDVTSDESDDELMEAVLGLSTIHLDPESLATQRSNTSDATTGHTAHESTHPLISPSSSAISSNSDYSTTVVRAHTPQSHPSIFSTQPEHNQEASEFPVLSSILTIRPTQNPNETRDPLLPHTPDSDGSNSAPASQILPNTNTESLLSIESYHTARGSSMISSSGATFHPSTFSNYIPLVHRFTLIKPGAKPKPARPASGGVSPTPGNPKRSRSGPGSPVRTGSPAATAQGSPGRNPSNGVGTAGPGSAGIGVWNPLDLFFASGLLVAKCDVCTKRLGWKPVLECDDCGLRSHVKCGEIAPRDCGVRPKRATALNGAMSLNFNAVSPLSKVRQNAKGAGSPPR